MLLLLFSSGFLFCLQATRWPLHLLRQPRCLGRLLLLQHTVDSAPMGIPPLVLHLLLSSSGALFRLLLLPLHLLRQPRCLGRLLLVRHSVGSAPHMGLPSLVLRLLLSSSGSLLRLLLLQATIWPLRLLP